MKKERAKIEGKKFGKLTVIAYHHTDKWGAAIWECKCDCGNTVYVGTSDLKKGHTQSCGCYQKQRASEAKTKHGFSEGSRLYTIWKNMRQRCINPNITEYQNYGGRGIRVCDEWSDYPSFMKWALANGYSDDLTIDRINNNGNYEPGNCRFITMKEQCRNKSNNHLVMINGILKPVSEWEEELQISRRAVIRRADNGKTT